MVIFLYMCDTFGVKMKKIEFLLKLDSFDDDLGESLADTLACVYVY